MAKKFLDTDGVQEHLARIQYPSSVKAWGAEGMQQIFGKLLAGGSKKVFPNISGPDFQFIFPENYQRVLSRLKPGQHASIGGICFMHTNMLTASKIVTDRNGRRRRIYLDLSLVLPQNIFSGGKPLQSSQLKRLNGAKISDTGWKLHTPGISQGVPLEVVAKVLRYFETARAAGTNLQIIIPTYEYTASTIANMRLLHMDQEKEARQTLEKIARNHQEVFFRMQKSFFPDVKFKVLMTHSPQFRAELNRFARKHSGIIKIKQGAADGVAEAFSPEQIKLIRKLDANESNSYKKLFSYFFSTSEPIIFMLHERDRVGYPLEGLQAAERVVGSKHLSENVLFLGVAGGPGVKIVEDAWPHLVSGYFGEDSKRLGNRDHFLPRTHDARVDGYFSRGGEKAYSNKVPKNVGKGMHAPAGRCPLFYYVRNIGHYVGVKEGPQYKVNKGLGTCYADTSHRECENLFKTTHSRLKRKLHPPKKKHRRRVQHRK